MRRSIAREIVVGSGYTQFTVTGVRNEGAHHAQTIRQGDEMVVVEFSVPLISLDES